MIAGTLAVLEEPAAKPLETVTSGGTLPALDVRTTQTDLQGDAVAQQGHAGGTVRTQTEDVMVARTRDDEKEPIVVTERVEGREEHHTEWVADVTGHGIVLVGSLGGGDEFARVSRPGRAPGRRERRARVLALVAEHGLSWRHLREWLRRHLPGLDARRRHQVRRRGDTAPRPRGQPAAVTG